MIDLYTWTTPNGRKISIMLEEAGLAYRVKPVNLQAREQFSPAFLAISPNNKIPAIVDHEASDETGPVTVFESGAILIYLAEKSGRFLPVKAGERAKVLEWLMWQMSGVGPIFGQTYHFTQGAPEKQTYAIERFTGESARLLKVLDTQLAKNHFVAGNDYSIADIALYPWVSASAKTIKRAKPDVSGPCDHVERWLRQVGDRHAVQRGMRVPEG